MPRVEDDQSAGEEDVRDKVTINVSGIKYETYISTLQNVPDTRLAWLTENLHDQSQQKEFFFDRHPGVFVHILNFYRTGRLHTPIDVCGPLFEEELQFWGIDEKQMEPCCWENFTKHREAEVNLRSFEGPGFEDLKKHRKASVIGRGRFFKGRTFDSMWYILDEPHSSTTAKYFSIVSCMVIVISVTIYCLDSIQQVRSNQSWKEISYTVNGVCLVWFTLEFILRCVFCPDKKDFVKSAMNWIDFTSLLPSYLSLILTSDVWLKNLVIIRLLRLFRFFKLSYGLQVLVHTLKASFYELTLLLLILLIPVVIFSSLVHTVEIRLNPNTTDFRSIPETFWWCLITMTTVGYGDMVPKTWAGRIIGGVCATCGILIVALPISVIGSNFSLYYSHVRARLKLPRKKRMLLNGHVRGLLKQPLSLSYRERDRRGLGKHRNMAIIRRETKLATSDDGLLFDMSIGRNRENGDAIGRQRRHAVFNTPNESEDCLTCEASDYEDNESERLLPIDGESPSQDLTAGNIVIIGNDGKQEEGKRNSLPGNKDNDDCAETQELDRTNCHPELIDIMGRGLTGDHERLSKSTESFASPMIMPRQRSADRQSHGPWPSRRRATTEDSTGALLASLARPGCLSNGSSRASSEGDLQATIANCLSPRLKPSKSACSVKSQGSMLESRV